MTIATYIFWICLFLLVYPYLIYPLILKLLARFFSANGKLAESREDWPAVSFIISAFNEEQVIGEKLENTLALDYPADKLEIIVISDASDDRTDEIVRAWSEKDSRIRLVRQEERRGKSAGLNHGVQAARGEAIVFSDANAMY
ncbi:MAG: glycosyltransferase, partial [Calditrichaeota bacterium]|nr:glycosyltransferase [Calditrichota bacterium]